MYRRLAFYLFILMFFALSSFSQDNLIGNSGFESGTTGWFPLVDPDSLYDGYIQSWCAGCGHDGSAGVELYVPESDGRWIGFGFLLSDFTPGETYHLAYDIKYECIGKPTVGLAYYDESMNIIGNSPPLIVNGESDWRRMELHLTIPDTISGVIFAVAANDSGRFWFDNCSLWVADTAMRRLVVDFDSDIGRIRNLSGVNCGPKVPHTTLDNTEEYLAMDIPMCRTHDWYGPGDRHEIFPDWDADPYDPESYYFASTDTFIQSIVDIGAEVFFRLGESWPVEDSFNTPPPDFDTWAIVCKHIVMHYNDGWADGFFYDINYWEIWNEPDLDIFWTGTYEQYHEMYVTVAETLAAYDPELQIGGPCVAGLGNREFVGGFLDAVSAAGARLDFFSWHWYEPFTPYNLISANRIIRQTLDDYGFTDTELMQTEWNMAVFNIIDDSLFLFELVYELGNAPINAAFGMGMIIHFQDESMAQLMRYRGDGELFGLIAEEDEYAYSGYSYLLMSELYDCPIRLSITNNTASCCAESTSFAIMAGKSEDGSDMAILLADWGTNRNGYDLEINNLPIDMEYKYELIALDDSLQNEIIDSARFISDGHFEFVASMNTPAVHLLKLTDVSGSAVTDEAPPENLASCRVWPNPFQSGFRFSSENGGKFIVYNIRGEKAAEFTVGENMAVEFPDGLGLKTGVYYIVNFKDSNSLQTKRAIRIFRL